MLAGADHVLDADRPQPPSCASTGEGSGGEGGSRLDGLGGLPGRHSIQFRRPPTQRLSAPLTTRPSTRRRAGGAQSATCSSCRRRSVSEWRRRSSPSAGRRSKSTKKPGAWRPAGRRRYGRGRPSTSAWGAGPPMAPGREPDWGDRQRRRGRGRGIDLQRRLQFLPPSPARRWSVERSYSLRRGPRHRRRRPRALPRRTDVQAAPGRRWPRAAGGPAPDLGTCRGQPPADPAAGPGPGGPIRAGTSPPATGAGAGRQGQLHPSTPRGDPRPRAAFLCPKSTACAPQDR